MPLLFTHTMNVSNAKTATLEAIKIVNKPWMKEEKSLTQKNWSVQIAVKFQQKIVQNMEKILQNSNVGIVVLLPNGSVGGLHIFVNLVIKDNVRETMYLNTPKINYLNAPEKINVL